MKKILLFLSFITPLISASQPAFSVFLVGDAGKDTAANELLRLMGKELKENQNSAVVFLGDNIYPKGFLEKKNARHETEKKRLLSQLILLKEYKGSAFFIPGNHDWRIGKLNGKKSVMQQCTFVNKWCSENTEIKNKSNGAFCPRMGECGPSSVMLTPALRLVMIDTQWWLHPFEANRKERSTFLALLDSTLAAAHRNGEKIIIAAHHPMFTNGRHAKARQPERFLINYTPLQIFGLLGLNRLLVQDLPQPKYRKMRRAFFKIFENYPGLIYAAGHEHNLQFSAPAGKKTGTPDSSNPMRENEGDDFFIVSGSGSKVTPLTEKEYNPSFSYDKGLGFFRIDFSADGKMEIAAYTAVNGKLTRIYHTGY